MPISTSDTVSKDRRRGKPRRANAVGYRRFSRPEQRPLHLALVAFNGLSRLPTVVVALILLGLAALVGLAWYWVTDAAWAGWAVGVYLAFAAFDWALLWLLPRMNVSHGPVEPPLLALAGLRLTLALAGTASVAWSGLSPSLALGLLASLYGGISVLSFYGVVIEPFRLTVTEMTLCSPKLLPDAPPVKVLQMGDFHIERRLTRRERHLLTRVKALAPDVIVLTGDYLNLSYVYDKEAWQAARTFLSQLHAPFGVYAVSGSPPVDPPVVVEKLFEGLDNICTLHNEQVALNVRGQRFHVVGIPCSHNPALDSGRLQASLSSVPQDAFTVVLYHSPDLMPEMVRTGVDLHLAGHTHGGQIRLPLYGALLTSSIYGKRYEMGHYQEGHTHLYVARGIGMEGMGAPRARFLCPPEIVLWTITRSFASATWDALPQMSM